MALYAFDGTGNKDEPGTDEDTNVLKFHEAYEGAYDGPGSCFYVSGVGTRLSAMGAFFGSVFGAGGHQRVEEAMERLERNFESGDRTIDIVGFSRGAALALEFVNEIHDGEVAGEAEPPIRFLGIWDTVASFGIPGNNTNLAFTLTLPKNVKTCCHAIALDERRHMFPLTRMVQDKFSGRELNDIREIWFRGYHSDVGGGNKNEPLSSIPLYWMLRQAMECDIHIPESHLSKQMSLRDPHAPCRKPGMDLIPNKKRTIRPDDAVHESVFRIEKADKFDANNPPVGLKVVDDDGGPHENGFEED